MRLAFHAQVLQLFFGVAASLTVAFDSRAQTVWSGFTFAYEKADFGNWTFPENQDRITDNVWLTRQFQQGLFNIALEDGYSGSLSPIDTEWATALMPENEGEVIAATNWEDLTFTDWINAYGGQASQELPARLVAHNAVVHLISDDVYLDLQFTDWTQGFGGGFSYLRSEGSLAPEPDGDYNENWWMRPTTSCGAVRSINQPCPQAVGPITMKAARLMRATICTGPSGSAT